MLSEALTMASLFGPVLAASGIAAAILAALCLHEAHTISRQGDDAS